ncbi:hypothetical protein [Phytohabitans rumicis]|uniref:Gram-positive cocci surface proteins LPxTG domain-containing protein n=1 Tax=Phytohabitans rumicis TaxID=1076125 RepID=A0A6V8LBJ3_9ACTN|nr:hypothetical protein [Phytohabitans rumicis]GFJ94583.1 hypothetical protein Prum_082250 [Phytohabitans rumicis]
MRAAWLYRLGVVAAAGVLVVGPASPAWAVQININPGNVPTTAAKAEQNCDPNFGGGPHPGEDVWVFNLPMNNGVFLSLTANFGANGSVSLPGPAGEIENDMGTSKAWIITPAGWTLTGASAEVTGTAPQFVLTHACATDSTPKPTVKPSGAPETGGGGGQQAGSVALGVGALAVAGAAGLVLTLSRRRRRGA